MGARTISVALVVLAIAGASALWWMTRPDAASAGAGAVPGAFVDDGAALDALVETRRRAVEAIDLSASTSRADRVVLWADALKARALTTGSRDDAEAAEAAYAEALASADLSALHAAHAVMGRADVAAWLGDVDRARGLYTQAAERFEALGRSDLARVARAAAL